MDIAETTSENWSRSRTLKWVVLTTGLLLVGWGAYWHLTIRAKLQAGHCDGCAPWHEFIVAPLVVGVVLVAGAGYLLAR